MHRVDDHLEPITGTPLRGNGKARDWSIPKEHAAAIVVLQDAYNIPSCQQSIYELAQRFLVRGDFHSICVEGARGPLDVAYARQFGATLEEQIAIHAPVSPGILQLLDTLRPDVQVWGVDDLKLCAEHHAVQRQCHEEETQWRQLVGHFREALAEAQQKTAYSESMCWLSRCLFPAHNAPALNEQVPELIKLGNTVKLEEDGFPLLMKFRQTLAAEQSLDFTQVEKERTAFVRQLVKTLDGWWQRSEDHLVLNPSQALPLLRFWLNKTQQSEADLEREVATHGIGRLRRRCQQWLYDFLIEGALQYREGMVSHVGYYNELLRLGLGLNIDLFRFAELLRYRAYVEEAAALSGGRLLDELQGYAEELIERLYTPAQREVYKLEKSFYLLSKAGGMSLTPDDVDALDEEMTWPVLRERLSSYSERAKIILLPGQIEATTNAAFQFCVISAQRSRIMGEETVRQLSTHGGNKVILVCGGYHTAAITRLLNARYQKIAWAVITPHMEADEVELFHQNYD